MARLCQVYNRVSDYRTTQDLSSQNVLTGLLTRNNFRLACNTLTKRTGPNRECNRLFAEVIPEALRSAPQQCGADLTDVAVNP